jgi:hypothetical protein
MIPKEIIEKILDAGRRAPSSHNCQPWLFKILNNATIEVWGDENRQLKESDKNNRQFFISLGCAIENMVTEADFFGYDCEISFFPNREKKFHTATLVFAQKKEKQEDSTHLAKFIEKRHSNREPFSDDRQIPQSLIDEIKNLASEEMHIDIIQDERRAKLSKVVMDATAAAFADEGFCQELSQWMRSSLKKYKDGMPGYNIGVPWLVSFLIPFAIAHFNLVKQQVAMVKAILDHTPAMMVISTKNDNPETWVRVGMVWEKIALMVTRAGANIGMLAAPIQIGEWHRGLQEILNSDLRPQTFSRLGFSNKVPVPSPRLDRDDIVRS